MRHQCIPVIYSCDAVLETHSSLTTKRVLILMSVLTTESCLHIADSLLGSLHQNIAITIGTEKNENDAAIPEYAKV